MKDRTRYWILHWLRVALWPLPVLTLVKALRGQPASSTQTRKSGRRSPAVKLQPGQQDRLEAVRRAMA
jgi:hypothetical protein